MDERYAYVGRGRGDYTQVTSMQPVAHGQGEFTKEKVVVRSGGAIWDVNSQGFFF